MRQLSTKVWVVSVAAVVLSACLFAAETPKAGQANVSQEKAKEGTAAAVGLLDQATRLVRYARENESSTAMLAAVEMLRRVQVRESKERFGEKTTKIDQPGEKGQKGSTPAPTLDPVAFLKEARTWAQGNTPMLALIDAELAKTPAKPAATMGSVGGPVRHIDRVDAHSSDVYTISFKGGEVARLVIVGDGDTDLDLFVLDENGNEIIRDDGSTDRCGVEWTPRWTGKFAIVVKNLGSVYNQYVMLSN